MTPIYLDTPRSNSFGLGSGQEHDHQLKLFLAPSYDHDQRSNPFHHDHVGSYNLVYNNVWHDETSDHHQVSPSSSTHPISVDSLKSSTSIIGGNDTNRSPNGLTVKWVSSKMRMMRKMMNNSNSNCAAATTKDIDVSDKQQKHRHDHDHQRQLRTTNPGTQINYFEHGNNDFVRVCSNCNTTKTPLWRGGPCGPKSLCNACGIRQRKARRAMEAAAAAAATNGTVHDSTTDTSSSSSTKNNYKVIKKEKKLHKNQYKKKCKQVIDQEVMDICDTNEYESTNNKKTCFEEFALNLLSENSGFRGVFPQDEEEGAVLLMALSCGLA